MLHFFNLKVKGFIEEAIRYLGSFFCLIIQAGRLTQLFANLSKKSH